MLEREIEAYRECTLPKDDDVHIQRLQVGWTVRILIETSEANQIIISEQLYFLSGLLHLDVLGGQRMKFENLIGD